MTNPYALTLIAMPVHAERGLSSRWAKLGCSVRRAAMLSVLHGVLLPVGGFAQTIAQTDAGSQLRLMPSGDSQALPGSSESKIPGRDASRAVQAGNAAEPVIPFACYVLMNGKGKQLPTPLPFGELPKIPVCSTEQPHAKPTEAAKKASLNDIFEEVAKVRRLLIDKGYPLADVYVREQPVGQDGRISLTVEMGRLGKVVTDGTCRDKADEKGSCTVNAAHGIDAQKVRSYLDAGGLKDGEVITADSLERAAYLLGDYKGATVKLEFEPGTDTGTANLLVGTSCAKRPLGTEDGSTTSECGNVEGKVDFDANGSIYTGVLRLGVAADILNPAKQGDVLGLRYARTIENPNLEFMRTSYLLPVGFNGWRVGFAYSGLKYRLGTPLFAPLQAHGTGAVGSALLTYPVWRSRLKNLFVSGQIDERRFRDDIDATGRQSEKSTSVMTVGLSGDWRDTWGGSFENLGGINVYHLSFTRGELAFTGPQATSFRAADTAGHRTADAYTKTTFGYSRLQGIDQRRAEVDKLINVTSAFYFAFNGQIASKNLDTSEKFSLGGPDAVRAYPPGETPADEGWTAAAELRVHLPTGEFRDTRAFPGNAVLTLFHDVGKARINKNPIPGTDLINSRKIAGAGIGLNLEARKRGPDNRFDLRDWSLRASVATRLTDRAQGESTLRNPRVYLQYTCYF